MAFRPTDPQRPMAFRPTDPQRSLLESEFLLPAKKRRLLESSWAVPFREVILPLINEDLFRESFKERGRPNVPINSRNGTTSPTTKSSRTCSSTCSGTARWASRLTRRMSARRPSTTSGGGC